LLNGMVVFVPGFFQLAFDVFGFFVALVELRRSIQR
jgi:hypothetical protein